MSIPAVVNAPIILYLEATTGQSSFGDLHIIKDGLVVSSPTVVVTEIVTGLYSLTYTPTSTGIYMFYAAGQIIDRIEVVTKSIYTFLRNIEDESLGSWSWDKTAGVLTLLRQDGGSFVSFNVIDDSTTASRELL